MKNSHFNRIIILVILLMSGVSTVSGQKPGFTFNQAGRWSPVFPADLEKALFRATMDVMDHHMTGLMLIKRTSDTSFRINFSNEVGMTFFDLESTTGKMKVISVFPDMNRKSLLSMLDTDFKMLLFRDMTVKSMDTEDRCTSDSVIVHHVVSARGKYTYTVHCDGLKLKGIESANKGFKRTILDFQYRDNSIPLKINVKNPSIRLNLQLIFLGS
jgi:hypothetical protein